MQLDEESLVAEFDRLVKADLIKFSEEQKLVEHFDGDLKFQFYITDALAKKPLIPGINPVLDAKAESQLRPGSDINTADFELGHVSKTHFVAMNKFCFIRPHLLLLTEDAYRRQHEPLDREDFEAAFTVMRAVGKDKDYVVYYNCGIDGGCSRLHKHVQFMPYPPDNFASFLDQRGAQETNVPFLWFHRRFDFDFEEATTDDVLPIYEELLEKSAAVAGFKSGGPNGLPAGAACPHNMIMTKRWMLVFPRRKATLGIAGANAVGMLGINAVSKQSEVDAWAKIGWRELLHELGFPK